jgi:hypothetical protein
LPLQGFDVVGEQAPAAFVATLLCGPPALIRLSIQGVAFAGCSHIGCLITLMT